MQTMKKYLLFLIALFGLNEAIAQQNPLYSQYLFNDYAVNPAVGGTVNFYDVRSVHRYQWSGIVDAPRTYTLTVHGPMKNRKMGIGGLLYTDHVGPTRRTGFQFSYSYLVNITSDIKLSFGVSAGLLQWTVDASKIRLRDEGDAVLSNGLQSSLVPDAKFGIFMYKPNSNPYGLGYKYYFSATAPNIMQNKLYFFENQTATLSKLEDHYYAAAGYQFELGNDFKIEPSALVKYVKPAPVQVDGSLRVIYQDMVWLGGSYRTNDAISMMVGYLHKGAMMFGYSYDLTTTNLGTYSNGTHEVMIGIRFISPESESTPAMD
jgi:type IX secretion system PorP/SprF family membrane protein